MIGLLHLFCDVEKGDMHCKPREVMIKKPGVLSCKDLDLPGDSNWPRAAFDWLTKNLVSNILDFHPDPWGNDPI